MDNHSDKNRDKSIDDVNTSHDDSDDDLDFLGVFSDDDFEFEEDSPDDMLGIAPFTDEHIGDHDDDPLSAESFDDADEELFSGVDHDVAGKDRVVNEEKVALFEEAMAEKNGKADSNDEPLFEPPQKKNYQSASNINELLSVTRETEDEPDDEEMEAIRRQISANRKRSGRHSGPKDIFLIDDANYDFEDEERQNAVAGDESSIKKMFYASIVMLASCVVLVVLAIGVLVNSGKTDNKPPQQDVVASGNGIDEIINAVGGENQGNSGNSGDSGDSKEDNQNGDSEGSDSSSDDSSDKKSEESDKNSVIYEVKAEGDIKSASVSYINGVGSAEQKTGATLPWTESVDADKSITPHMAVATSGRGTITCTIIKDGETIAEKTSSGDSPGVECRE